MATSQSTTIPSGQRPPLPDLDDYFSNLRSALIDARNVAETVALIKRVKPDLVINMALPYQDLPIMDACLETGVHYLDTANYEPRDVAKFEYSWQWKYQDRYKDKGVMAILGCGPGPRVGRALRYLAERVAEDPERNQPAALRELLARFAAES